MEEKRIVEMGEERSRHQHFEEEEDEEGEDSEEHKLQSRYGIWLMVELCKPKEDVPIVSTPQIEISNFHNLTINTVNVLSLMWYFYRSGNLGTTFGYVVSVV